MRIALLSLLEERPKHGYELMKELEARSGGLYHPSAGTIYPSLQQLADEGLVVPQTEQGRVVYQITEAGRRLLLEERKTIEHIWRRARQWESWAPWMGPEVFMIAGPISELMKVALRATTQAAGDSERIARIHEVLRRCSRELETIA